jgi:hypothetical protein
MSDSMSTPTEQPSGSDVRRLFGRQPSRSWVYFLGAFFVGLAVVLCVTVMLSVSGPKGAADYLCGMDAPAPGECITEWPSTAIQNLDARLVVRLGTIHYRWDGGGCWDREVEAGSVSIEVEDYGSLTLERQGDELLVNGHPLQPGESWQDTSSTKWLPLKWMLEQQQILVRHNGVFDCVESASSGELRGPVDILYVTDHVEKIGFSVGLVGILGSVACMIALVLLVRWNRRAQISQRQVVEFKE